MKIAWFCIPAQGHTNPTLGLVRYLVEAGHQVTYFSFERFRQAIQATGAQFVACDDYGDFDLGLDERESSDRSGKDLAFATHLLVQSTLAMEGPALEALKALQPDLVVGDSMATWAKLLAKKLNLPYVCSNTTFAFNKESSRYMRQSIWALLKLLWSMPSINRELNRLRERGYEIGSVLDLIQNDEATPTLVYTSPYFQPCWDSFGSNYHFIGPSIRPVQKPYPKTRAKTIYVSLGTVVHNEDFYRAVIEAFRDLPDYQVIIALGQSELNDWQGLPDHIEIHDRVDQMAVLAIADVFITHCGMNSASEGLYHQVPLILCPQTPEQGAVAKRTAELGAGYWLKLMTPATIRRAVLTVLEEPHYRDAAGRVAKSFKASGGYQEALTFMEQVAQNT